MAVEFGIHLNSICGPLLNLSFKQSILGVIHFQIFLVCPGTDNSRTELQDKNRINQLIRQYQNCTRVYGNLEITYIRDEHLNGTDPEQFFSFLNNIQQVCFVRVHFQIFIIHISL